jgi:hypothetical protein
MNPKCECPDTSSLELGFESWYDPETELPFVNHLPGACACTNEIKLYRQGKQLLYLCSSCHTFNDNEVKGNPQ